MESTTPENPPARTAARSSSPRQTLASADKIASALSAAAIVCAASALYRGMSTAEPEGFLWIAPATAAVFLVAMIAMFLDANRHGISRWLHMAGAAVLAVAALYFTGKVSAARILFAYWAPAVLSLLAAIALARGHRLAEARARH